MANTVKDTIATRRVAILAADGADAEAIRRVREAIIAGARRRSSSRRTSAC
jgi:hypothetical protein